MTTPSSPQAALPATPLSRVGRVLGRLGWGVADQALSSLTNFAVGIYVARSLGTEEFGAFSLAFATYLIVRNASQGLASDPLVVRYSGAEVTSWRSAVAKSTGVATAIGLITGAGCVIVGVLLDGSTGRPSSPWGYHSPACCCRTTGAMPSSPWEGVETPSGMTSCGRWSCFHCCQPSW